MKQIIKGIFIFILAFAVALTFTTTLPVNAKTISWKGTWKIKQSDFSGGVLEISKLSKSKFYFTLNVNYGANVAFLDGYAKYKGNTATFDDKDGCKVKFKKSSKKINIEEIDSCDSYRGLNVYFDGEYFIKKTSKVPVELIKLGIFKSKTENDVFYKLVKNDYGKFVESMELIEENVDNEKLKAKVYSGGIRGLYTLNEAIVMYDKKKRMWAAVIVDGKKIYYYTNVPSYKKKYPKTFKEWSSGFSNYPIIYKSK